MMRLYYAADYDPRLHKRHWRFNSFTMSGLLDHRHSGQGMGCWYAFIRSPLAVDNLVDALLEGRLPYPTERPTKLKPHQMWMQYRGR